MNECMSVVLLIISIRLREDQVTSDSLDAREDVKKVKLIEEASHRINGSVSFLFLSRAFTSCHNSCCRVNGTG